MGQPPLSRGEASGQPSAFSDQLAISLKASVFHSTSFLNSGAKMPVDRAAKS
jgi:hypothetical protein